MTKIERHKRIIEKMRMAKSEVVYQEEGNLLYQSEAVAYEINGNPLNVAQYRNALDTAIQSDEVIESKDVFQKIRTAYRFEK